MSIEYVRGLIPLQQSVYKRCTDDGIIMGHGLIDRHWLNRTHQHNEGTDQWAYIEHLPAPYVQKGIDTNRKIIDNIGKWIDKIQKVLEKLTKSPKAHFAIAGNESFLQH